MRNTQAPTTPGTTMQQGKRTMVMSLIRHAAIAAGALFAVAALPVQAPAADDVYDLSYGYDGSVARQVKVGLNKSVVIDLPRDARDILVSNPVIADAVIRTPTRIYITGVAVGQANVIVFDRAGQQIVSLELEVERDSVLLNQMLNRLIPEADIMAEVISDNIVLTGSVRNSSDSRKAEEIANIFANGGAQAGGAAQGQNGLTQVASSSVVNMLAIQGEDQVQIKVTVAEVNRTLAKQLGARLDATVVGFGSVSLGDTSIELGDSFADLGDANAMIGAGTFGGNSVSARLRMLQTNGLVRTLAEPTLTAISGESASFHAGGEFPIEVLDPETGRFAGIEFKPYGVLLSFTPVVLSEGRISLRMRTEVSELGEELRNGSRAINVRRADTTLELPSGGAMVLGGLLQDTVRQSIRKMPGLGDIPVLGTLFRSRDYQRNETELVIIATPYLVKPTSRNALSTPDVGFASPNDVQGNFFGALNRRYGTATGQYQGQAGFIFE